VVCDGLSECSQPVSLFLNFQLEQPIDNPLLIRILVVDDFADWRRFVLEKLLESSSLIAVGVASDGLEAVLQAEKLQPDLILLDIGLPKLDGIEAARRIRKVAQKSRILFLSQLVDIEVAQAALNAGGHGYVIKSEADGELFAAIEAVWLGRKFVSPRLVEQIVEDSATQSLPVETTTAPAKTVRSSRGRGRRRPKTA
jgi:DNA-binding NarL/FixJ family response regulator